MKLNDAERPTLLRTLGERIGEVFISVFYIFNWIFRLL